MSWMVERSGSPDAKAKGTLYTKVKQMVADGGLTATIGEWVDHVRDIGNAGAHPDQLGPVTLDEAKELSRIVATLIDLLYVTPARIAEMKAGRKP